MTKLLNVPLSEKEEKFIISVIVELATGSALSEEDVLHRLIEMAQSHEKLILAKRTLRKKAANIKNDKCCCNEKETVNDSYIEGFMDCVELLTELFD